MKTFRSIVGALGIIAPLALSAGSASAEDTLKVVIGQINNWENQAPTLGQEELSLPGSHRAIDDFDIPVHGADRHGELAHVNALRGSRRGRRG